MNIYRSYDTPSRSFLFPLHEPLPHLSTPSVEMPSKTEVSDAKSTDRMMTVASLRNGDDIKEAMMNIYNRSRTTNNGLVLTLSSSLPLFEPLPLPPSAGYSYYSSSDHPFVTHFVSLSSLSSPLATKDSTITSSSSSVPEWVQSHFTSCPQPLPICDIDRNHASLNFTQMGSFDWFIQSNLHRRSYQLQREAEQAGSSISRTRKQATQQAAAAIPLPPLFDRLKVMASWPLEWLTGNDVARFSVTSRGSLLVCDHNFWQVPHYTISTSSLFPSQFLPIKHSVTDMFAMYKWYPPLPMSSRHYCIAILND
jgi:hypothetical protein